MYILAIETTGQLCSVALLKDDKITGSKCSREQKNHLRDLTVLIAELMEEAGVTASQISHIAVSRGPGSFTGIRIGVSTARALVQVWKKSAVPVGTLDAFLMKRKLFPAECDDRLICGIINARRGQVYGTVEELMPPGPYMIGDVLDVIKTKAFTAGKKVIFFGDGTEAYGERIDEELGKAGAKRGADYFFAGEEIRYQDAPSAGLLATEKIKLGQTVDSPEDLLPDYMRKAEAEQKLEAGTLKLGSFTKM